MDLARLNPFRNLPNPREVWAWGMYDLANQSFTLLINTLLFAIFFREVVVADDARGDRLWGAIFSGSLLIVVVLSPFVGAYADFRARKKRLLIGFGASCVAFTCALGILQPGWVLLAILLYIPAHISYSLGENLLAGFLPEIAKPARMGQVSAIGWTMGYVGALLLLVISAAAMWLFGLQDHQHWRPLIVFAGVWFLIMAIPTVLYLHERKRPEPLPPGRTIAGASLARLADTVRHARRYGHLLRFLGVFLLYSTGTWTVIAFAGIVAREFGIKETNLVFFVLQLTITAGIAAVGTGIFQDRFGHRNTIMLFLGIWLVTALGMAYIASPTPTGEPRPQWMFWVVGNGVGLGLGGIGTASRAMVGTFTPGHKSAEFFGLWGLALKMGGVLGPVTFGQVKAGMGNRPAFLLLSAVFLAALFLMMLISERGGRLAARQAEREEAARVPKNKHDAQAPRSDSPRGQSLSGEESKTKEGNTPPRPPRGERRPEAASSTDRVEDKTRGPAEDGEEASRGEGGSAPA